MLTVSRSAAFAVPIPLIAAARAALTRCFFTYFTLLGVVGNTSRRDALDPQRILGGDCYGNVTVNGRAAGQSMAGNSFRLLQQPVGYIIEVSVPDV